MAATVELHTTIAMILSVPPLNLAGYFYDDKASQVSERPSGCGCPPPPLLVGGNIIRRTQNRSNVDFEFAQIGKRKAALRRLLGLKLANKATLRYGKYNKHQSQNG